MRAIGSVIGTILAVIFVLVLIVSASGDAQAKADGQKVAEMGIGTVVNGVIVMAKATVGALAGVGGDTAAADGGADGDPATAD